MRFSIPLGSRNHLETYSRWINAFGLVCVLGAIFWGVTLRFHFLSYYLLMLALMAIFLIVVASGLHSRSFVRRPDRNPDEQESPSSKSARV
jgi:hypothetical protein